jgi:hypothetical protein
MSRFGIFTINGTDYDLDDLDLDEIEEIEERSGSSAFSEMNFGSSKTMKALAFVLMRRSDPAVTWEQIGKVKLLTFLPADEEALDSGPPAEGAPVEGSHNGSEPVVAGVPA